jgi:exoribonuclease R
MPHAILSTTNYSRFSLVDPNIYICIDAEWITAAAAAAAKVLCGDSVDVTPSGDGLALSLQKRAKHPPLVGLLDICSKAIYGMSSRGTPQFLFYPMNRAYPPFLVGYAAARIQNQLVVCRFQSWDEADKFPRGSLERVIGPAGDYEAEQEALLLSACPWRQVRITRDDICIGADVAQREHINRANDWTTFNIDPAGCRDVDDVFSYRPLATNRPAAADDIYEVAISIADVAAIIEEGSATDMAACERGQTLYVDGVAAAPMLPAFISEDACSLLAGTVRPCVSLIFEVDARARSVSCMRFALTTVTNDRTYTYEEFGAAADAAEAKAALGATVGAIQSTAADSDSVSDSVTLKASLDSHFLIESLMIFYNKEAAKRLWTVHGGLLRCHTAGNFMDAEKLRALHPDLGFMCMEAATYVASARVDADHYPIHSMFSDSPYCHATSPIRRYADLVNQRVLKGIIRSRAPLSQPSSQSLQFIELHLNDRAKVARKFERDMFFLQILYKWRTEGTALNGICIDVENRGEKVKVYIPAWKKVVTVTNYDGAIQGDEVRLSYWFDPSKPRWKNRILFRIDDLLV